MEITPVHTLNLSGVLSESKRIVRANYSHFFALSALFLPLSFSLLINPTLRLSGQFFTADYSPKFPPDHQKAVIFHLVYVLIVYVLSLCAIATITYSTYHGFFGKPVKFFPAVKSLSFSFFQLAATAIVAHILLCLISLSFLLFVGVIIMFAQNLGFVIDYNSIYFMWFSAVVGAASIVVIIYFQLNWSLAFVVVVAESKWGFGPLMRSSYLVRGMRSVSLSLLLLYGILGGLLVWVYSDTVLHYGLSSWAFVLYTVMGSIFLMLFFLQSTAANTVLYLYCKALHGELAIEIAEEFAHEYISLPSDYEKVPHVVTVVPS